MDYDGGHIAAKRHSITSTQAFTNANDVVAQLSGHHSPNWLPPRDLVTSAQSWTTGAPSNRLATARV